MVANNLLQKATMDLKRHIRSVPDFPKPGILFYDISTLLAHPVAWRTTVHRLTEALQAYEPDLLVGIESRGFLIVRKKGKLPGATTPLTYDLEYGSDTIEIQADAIKPGRRVVILDDLLATGGTMAAAIALCRSVGAEVVAAACIIELSFLGGRQRIDVPVTSMVAYDS